MSRSRRREIKADGAPAALGPYHQAVVAEDSNLVFVSGQIGIDPATGELVGGGVGPQTERCLKSVLAIVKTAGGTERSLLKTTVYLAEIADFAAMNEAYSRAVSAPYPARSCVAGCDLPKGALVEIEAVALSEG